MTAIDLLVLLTAHFVADFKFQSNWMAMNKSRNWGALAFHVGVYTSVMAIVSMALVYSQGLDLDRWNYWVHLTFVTHFATDAVTSRWTTKLWFFQRLEGMYQHHTFPNNNEDIQGIVVDPWIYRGGNRHWFFVTIGFDQLIHTWTLALTWMWIYGK